MSESKLIKEGLSLKDIAVVQAESSVFNHRKYVNPYITICGKDNILPVIVSPMASVTDENNYKVWIENGFMPVIPRSVKSSFGKRIEMSKETFVSISLSEAWDLSTAFEGWSEVHYICIDIANGTMEDLYNVCRKLKDKHKENIVIMTGNVANPKAYIHYAKAGIDYMRVSVGTGSRCTTACNTGIFYPMATLLDELRQEQEKYPELPKVKLIADGGIKNFDDIQKAIALGAECVMSGNIFARAEEACGKTFYGKNIFEKIKNHIKGQKYREYYGMSTKRAQKETGGVGNKTAEGISRPVPVEYPIAKWRDNMESFLRSNMTYTDSGTLEDLRRNSEIIILAGTGDITYRK